MRVEPSSGGGAESFWRPKIAPVEVAADRPLWSVMIPTFDSSTHLAECLESVLAQDPGSDQMQIELVADHSDRCNAASVIAQIAPDRVQLFRQSIQLGNVGNFNTCLARARGHLVHLLHDDDRVEPGFYEVMARPFAQSVAVGAAFCRYVAIDEDGRRHNLPPLEQGAAGVLPGWARKLATGQRLQPPCMVVRRDVYESLGGFDERLRGYAEDWEMWVRIAASYSVWYEPAPLAAYRIGTSSLSSGMLRTGRNVRNLRLAIALNSTHFEPTEADAICRFALRSTALTAFRRGKRSLIQRNDRIAFWSQLREGLASDSSPPVVIRAIPVAALGAAWPALRLLRIPARRLRRGARSVWSRRQHHTQTHGG